MLAKRFGIADASRASTGSLRMVESITTFDGPFTSDGGGHGVGVSDSRVRMLNRCSTALILG